MRATNARRAAAFTAVGGALASVKRVSPYAMIVTWFMQVSLTDYKSRFELTGRSFQSAGHYFCGALDWAKPMTVQTAIKVMVLSTFDKP